MDQTTTATDATRQPVITFGIPCYNSAEYMDHCIESILEGSGLAEDVQIVIVNDGSTKDDTAAKADEWHERHPSIIDAVHQENGGHGTAVLTGLKHARGVYYKVVDSDDWLDADALKALLETLRGFVASGEHVDLVVTNYVYEHTLDNTQKVVNYHHAIPLGKVIGWEDTNHFSMQQNLLMHAITYRVDVLREGGLPLPAHTFYVDNIYAYVPLPRCKTLYYLDVDLYRYFIGREDQSVNESIMTARIDQQIRITRIMMHSYHLLDDVESPKLRKYMLSYFVLMMVISSVFSKLSDAPDAKDNCIALWTELKNYDKRLYRRVRMSFLGLVATLPGRAGDKTTIGVYHLAQKIVKFN